MGFHGTKKVGKRVRALARGSGFRFHFNPSRFNPSGQVAPPRTAKKPAPQAVFVGPCRVDKPAHRRGPAAASAATAPACASLATSRSAFMAAIEVTDIARKATVIAAEMPVRDQPVASAIGVSSTGRANSDPIATTRRHDHPAIGRLCHRVPPACLTSRDSVC